MTVHKPHAPIEVPFDDVELRIVRSRSMHEVALALGSNMGDSAAILQGAVDDLASVDGISVIAVSRAYETDPVGGPEQDAYLNAVALVVTDLDPWELLAVTQSIEQHWHRVREVRWGPRTLDIDILAVGEETVDSDDLVIPHPRAHERAFVLVPWLDVDPEAPDPRPRAGDATSCGRCDARAACARRTSPCACRVDGSRHERHAADPGPAARRGRPSSPRRVGWGVVQVVDAWFGRLVPVPWAAAAALWLLAGAVAYWAFTSRPRLQAPARREADAAAGGRTHGRARDGGLPHRRTRARLLRRDRRRDGAQPRDARPACRPSGLPSAAALGALALVAAALWLEHLCRLPVGPRRRGRVREPHRGIGFQS